MGITVGPCNYRYRREISTALFPNVMACLCMHTLTNVKTAEEAIFIELHFLLHSLRSTSSKKYTRI